MAFSTLSTFSSLLNSYNQNIDVIPTDFISPNQISNMYLWLDANDDSTFTFTDSTFITIWNDKSGYMNNAYNNTSTIILDTINSKKSVFYPIGQSLSIDNFVFDTFPFTYFAVFNFSGELSTNDTNALLSATNPPDQNGILYQQFDNTDYKLAYGATGGDSDCLVVSNSFNNSGLTLVTFQIDGSNNVILNINGQSSIETSNLLHTPLHTNGISSSSVIKSMLGMYVSEMLLYRSKLSLADYLKIEGYLAWKWGIRSKLSSSHLYFKFAPVTYSFSGSTTFQLPTATYATVSSIAINDDGFMIMTTNTKGIFYSRTYGSTWFLSNAPTNINWVNCSMNNNGIAFACNAASVYYSTDAGITWSLTGAPTPPANTPYAHISVNNNGNVIVMATNIPNNVIYASLFDKTYTVWKSNTIVVNTILQISLADNGYGMIAGNTQFISLTNNYGDTWTTLQKGSGAGGTVAWAFGGSISPSGNYLVGNSAGTPTTYVRYSTNNGTTWNSSPAISGSSFSRVVVGNNGTVLGSGSFIYKLGQVDKSRITLSPTVVNIIAIMQTGIVIAYITTISGVPTLIVKTA